MVPIESSYATSY